MVTISQCAPIILWLCSCVSSLPMPPSPLTALLGALGCCPPRLWCLQSPPHPLFLVLPLGRRGFLYDPHLSKSDMCSLCRQPREMAILKGTQRPFHALHSETLCSPSNSATNYPFDPLGGRERRDAAWECLLSGLWSQAEGDQRGSRPGSPEAGQRRKLGARHTEKGMCYSWRRGKQETDRKRSRGIGKVNPESPLFYVVWSILLGREKGF